MRPFRAALHPILLVAIGLASGALALGASALVPRPLPERSAARQRPVPASPALPLATPGPAIQASQAAPPAWFPGLFNPAAVVAAPAGAPSAESASIPVIANNLILAFYGKPDSTRMGILGEYSKEDLAKLLEGYARLYDDLNGEEGVVPAFYLIYGTCWPGGEIGYLKDSVLREYIDFARQRGWLVFVDHQIGKYPVSDAVKRLLPWLKYPNVHIALDPEWRTESPMKVIGGVSAEEINEAEAEMSAYMRSEGIPGARMLVVHQFQEKMIADKEKVKADFDGVLLVHTADGFGPPALKRWSYATNAKADNMPLKGFKLFFKTDLEGAGYDDPLLLPAEVLALEPSPRLVIYQ
jgi:hypothetical protein